MPVIAFSIFFMEYLFRNLLLTIHELKRDTCYIWSSQACFSGIIDLSARKTTSGL